MQKIDIKARYELQKLNTLGVPSVAEFFVQVHDYAQLKNALQWAQKQNVGVHILGGGSNVILGPHINGLVIAPNFLFKQCVKEDDNQVLVQFGAGENWHEVVTWCLQHGFYGLENLALIPGSVGAAPVQNIGAYGVELDHVFYSLEAYCPRTCNVVTFDRNECEFAYRHSIFKQPSHQHLIITKVTFALHKKAHVNVTYPALLNALNTPNPSPQQVYQAVCEIRSAKLPDPKTTPNCGSFFKNPILPLQQFNALKTVHPAIPHYPTTNPSLIKVAAAWLIDQAGWRGKFQHGVGVHAGQALVLVNPDYLPAKCVLALAQDIQHSIATQFGVTLELEPNCIDVDFRFSEQNN